MIVHIAAKAERERPTLRPGGSTPGLVRNRFVRCLCRYCSILSRFPSDWRYQSAYCKSCF